MSTRSLTADLLVGCFRQKKLGGYGLLMTLFLCSCASLPRAHSEVQVVHALPIQKGDKGFYYDTADRDYLISEGIPLSAFQNTPRGWFLSRTQAIMYADLIDDSKNK